jgi:outer membrane protein insertion porin family
MTAALALLLAAAQPLVLEGVEAELHVPLQRIWQQGTHAPEAFAQLVRRVYMRSGRYLAKVEVRTQGGALRVRVAAGSPARIVSVQFIGNKVLSAEILAQRMFNRKDSAGARLMGLGRFAPEALGDDATGVRQAYFDAGYIFATVGAPRVFVDKDLRGVRLEVPIEEGEPYTVGSLEVTGLPKGLAFGYREGDLFAVARIHTAVRQVEDYFRNLGHANVRVEESSAVEESSHSVRLKLNFIPGPICRVERVEVVGLQRVESAAIERLLRIVPGQRYDHALVLEEISRLRGLGLISDAQPLVKPGSTPDQVVVQVRAVDAMQRWFPAFTVTYVPGEGSVLLLQLSTPNLLGKGIRFSGSSWLSAQRRLFDFNVSLPGFLSPLGTASGEMHNRDRSMPLVRHKAQGGSLGYGVSLDRRRRLSVAGRLAAERYTTTVSELFDQPVGEGATYRLKFGLSASYDNRDSGLMATRGHRLALGLDWAPQVDGWLDGRAGFSVDARQYVRLPLGFRLRAQLAARGLLGAHHHPSDRLYAGGMGTLRGFYAFAVAPQVLGKPGAMLGGDKLAHTTIELGRTVGSVFEPFVFVDGANAFHQDEGWLQPANRDREDTGGLIWSAGWGVLLRLPVLPLRFEWGYPLVRSSRDPKVLFSLGVGTGI